MLTQHYWSTAGAIAIASGILKTAAYDNSRSNNLAVYWGQDSYGAANPSSTAKWQHNLSGYCHDDVINVIPLAFLDVFFSIGGDPEINFANSFCGSSNVAFPGTNLANCEFMAADIEACQARGKIVTISLGGASGAATLSSDSQGRAFARTIWDLFLGGNCVTRPFGRAVLDGYYVTAAPQCPFPDANLGSVLNAASFDAIYVQFYDNYCENSEPSAWNFATWDNWARTQSLNPNVKIYIGAPASPSAANSGYVDAITLGNLAASARSRYPSFGGIMLWDASQLYVNDQYHIAVKNAMFTSPEQVKPE
ncbi:hypothetical protein APHAL10511_004217 [Amanita phalloides]|nr:hypothetical protein APHAL10511_004217 [Amanita phalloides]